MKFYRDNLKADFYWRNILDNRLTAILSDYYNAVLFFKNGKEYNDKNAAYIYGNKYKQFCLNDKDYGTNNDFTKESWRRFSKLQAFL
jgi:hypothetical protein